MRHRLVLLTGSLLAIAGGLAGIAVLTSQSPAARPQVRGHSLAPSPQVGATAGRARYSGLYVYATGRHGTRNPGNGLSPNPNFFPLMVWYQGTANLSAYRSIGINTFIAPDAYSSTDLATLKSAGMNGPRMLDRRRSRQELPWRRR